MSRSGLLQRVGDLLNFKRTPILWHSRLTQPLGSQLLEENLRSLRGMRESQKIVLALSVSSTQKWINTSRTIALYQALLQTSKRINSPLFTFAEESALGDSYLLLCAGQKVHANPFALIGNVNSQIQYISLEKLLERLGVKYEVFNQATSRVFAESRAPTEKEIRLAEASTNDVVAAMQDFILERRAHIFESKGISREVARKTLLSGETFSASAALANGMIDEITTFYDFKEENYPQHKLKKPKKILGGTFTPVPALSQDILEFSTMLTQAEAQGSIGTGQLDVQIAEFLAEKLKQPDFVSQMHAYLTDQFYSHKALIDRRQQLIESLEL